MGNDTSKATGTDFERNQRNRERDNAAEDLPSIPFLKQKRVTAEVNEVVRKSIYLANYKRAFRGYLRKNPHTNQMGTMMRIHWSSMGDANRLGLDKDTYEGLIQELVIQHAPDLNPDIIEFLEERKKLKPSDPDDRKLRMSEENLGKIFEYMVDEAVDKAGRKLYDKYSRGGDYEASDSEMDREKLAKLQAEKEARLKKAAEERQKQAEQFLKEAAEEEEQQRRREEAVRQRQEEQKAIEQAKMDTSMI